MIPAPRRAFRPARDLDTVGGRSDGGAGGRGRRHGDDFRAGGDVDDVGGGVVVLAAAAGTTEGQRDAARHGCRLGWQDGIDWIHGEGCMLIYGAASSS